MITELKSRNAIDRILFGTDAPLGCFGENPVAGVSEKEAYEMPSIFAATDDIIEKDEFGVL